MRDLNHPKRPSTQLHNPHLCWLNHHLPMGFPMVFPWFPKWFFDVCPMFFRWFFYVVPMVFLWFPFFYVVPMVFYGFLWFFYGFPAKKKKNLLCPTKKANHRRLRDMFRHLQGQDPVIASRQMQWQGQVLGSARGSHKK